MKLGSRNKQNMDAGGGGRAAAGAPLVAAV